MKIYTALKDTDDDVSVFTVERTREAAEAALLDYVVRNPDCYTGMCCDDTGELDLEYVTKTYVPANVQEWDI